MLVFGSVMGVLSAFIGSLLSSSIRGMSTGPAIIVCMTACLAVAFIWNRHARKETTHV